MHFLCIRVLISGYCGAPGAVRCPSYPATLVIIPAENFLESLITLKKNRLFLLDSPYPVKIIKKGMVSIWIHSRQKSWLECILFSRWSSHLWHSSAVVLQRAHNVWTGKEQLDLFLYEINQCHCKLCWYFDCFLRKFKIV